MSFMWFFEMVLFFIHELVNSAYMTANVWKIQQNLSCIISVKMQTFWVDLCPLRIHTVMDNLLGYS